MNHTIGTPYSLPAPVSKEELLNAIPELYLLQFRELVSFVPVAAIRALLPENPCRNDSDFLTQEFSASDLGLTPSAIEATPLIDTLSRLYDFAYHGVRYEGAEPMGPDSDYTWAAAVVLDMKTSYVAAMYRDSGAEDAQQIAALCAQVAETANARVVLEGGEGFLSLGSSTAEDGWYTGQALTIRQMALLAGMEESSIRTAANPRKPNALKTHRDENGSTRIAADVAKAWLVAKGRYVEPVVKFVKETPVDLLKTTFSSTFDIHQAVCQSARYAWSTAADDAQREALAARLRKFGVTYTEGGFWGVGLQSEDLADAARMRDLAEVLGLSPDLFVMRVRQGLATQALKSINKEIEASLASPSHLA